MDNKDNTSEIDLTDISLRPNPAMNDLQISSKADNNISNVGIYNITGEQVIRVRNVNKSAERIDVSRLEAGMYIINVTTTEGTESKKFIKG